jgi:hypothetical protein
MERVAAVDVNVAALSRDLTWRDRVAHWKARWGMGRMHMSVTPGLYRLGAPDRQAPVFVTANYKLSFDALRSNLAGLDAWILVLDTKGVNVWCAAGKGTFGTEELIHRVRQTELAAHVDGRRLILPQLGAPGVAAHLVKEHTGFTVVWGPVEARDISAFMQAGTKATPAMRAKQFPLGERIKVTPIELVQAAKPVALVLLAVALIMLLFGRPFRAHEFLQNVGPILVAVLAGAFLTPILLPWIPFRAFAAKGALVGALCAALMCFALNRPLLGALGWVLLPTALASYLAMNFTGASTFSNPSGVRKELRYAIPAQLVAALAGLLLIVLL